jgi:hypothetical protein
MTVTTPCTHPPVGHAATVTGRYQTAHDSAALTLCRAFGLSYALYRGADDSAVLWDGHQFHLPVDGDQWGTSMWWHEFCHWLIASVEERRQVNFGLGAPANAGVAITSWDPDRGVRDETFSDDDLLDDDGGSALRTLTYRQIQWRETLSTSLALFETAYVPDHSDSAAVARTAQSLFYDFGGDTPARDNDGNPISSDALAAAVVELLNLLDGAVGRSGRWTADQVAAVIASEKVYVPHGPAV